MNQPQTFESERNSTHGSIPALADSTRLNLPVAYQTAKQAVALCESTDECRTWADKHAALAAYAKMRDDKDLHNYALRIQLRAERRWGELDRELFPDKHLENLQNSRKVVDRLSSAGPRPAAADGTSEFQRKTARRLAAIPEETFERQIESPTPPTKTKLAEQGAMRRTVVRDPSTFTPVDRPSSQPPQSPHALKAFAEFCESADPISLASTVTAEDRETVRGFVTIAERWLERFVDNLPSADW